MAISKIHHSIAWENNVKRPTVKFSNSVNKSEYDKYGELNGIGFFKLHAMLSVGGVPP